MAMTPVHRHQLAWLSPAGWAHVRDRAWDDEAQACLGHWAARQLPLVVTTQRTGLAGPDALALGLSAPRRWGRRRLALSVRPGHIAYFDEFPRAQAIDMLLPERVRPAWRWLCAGLEACGARPRVHGSHGWQLLTRLAYVHRASDLDLCAEVDSAEQADAVAMLLQAGLPAGPRLDGELVFLHGRAIAWREWLAWRAGRVKSVLVKHIAGSTLTRDPLAPAMPLPAGALA